MIKFNDRFSPMLLKEVYKPFNNKDYIYELKFDGIRALIYVSSDTFKIISRNKQDLTSMFPELKNIQKLVKEETIFDGEIVLMNNGKPSFSSLQNRIHLKNKNKIKSLSENNPVVYVCFDTLYKDKDLTKLPLIERKKHLNNIKDTKYFVKSKVFNDGLKLFEKVKENNLEGVVAKLKDSPYEINKRTDNWVKIKNLKSEYFYICGYLENKNNTVSLLLCEKIKMSYHYVGKVLLSKKNKVYKELQKQKKTRKTIISIKNAIYIEPNIKIKVHYLERTSDGSLREGVIR